MVTATGYPAVWWVGSAAVGSLVLALWIGPAIRRAAAEHDLRTVGDFLEFRFGVSVRTAIAVLLWVGSLFILAGQLIAIASILNVIVGVPPAVGCAVGGLLITIYFTAGGLLTSAWVNMVQLTVKLVGFAIALPLALAGSRRMDVRVAGLNPAPDYWNPWHGGHSGLIYLAMLAPAFVVSPGLLQKIYGARDDRAVRLGVGANAIGLAVYAMVPVIMGMIARAAVPQPRGAASRTPHDPDARRTADRRRHRARRGVLGGAERRRCGPLHADDVAVAGFLQALREPRQRKMGRSFASRA